jgi:hypothetical protein
MAAELNYCLGSLAVLAFLALLYVIVHGINYTSRDERWYKLKNFHLEVGRGIPRKVRKVKAHEVREVDGEIFTTIMAEYQDGETGYVELEDMGPADIESLAPSLTRPRIFTIRKKTVSQQEVAQLRDTIDKLDSAVATLKTQNTSLRAGALKDIEDVNDTFGKIAENFQMFMPKKKKSGSPTTEEREEYGE